MSVFQGILLFLVGSICGMASATEEFQFHRPILAGALTGLVLGDLQAGIICGGTLELISLGWMTIGLAVPPDTALSAVVVAILVTLGKQSLGVALGLAIPIALFGALLLILQKSILDVALMHWAEKGVENYKFWRIDAAHYLTGVLSALRVGIPALLVANLADINLLQHYLSLIPSYIINGMQLSTSLLILVGFAMLLNLLNRRDLLPFLFLGFITMTYTQMTLVSLSITALSIGILYYNLLNKEKLLKNLSHKVLKDEDINSQLIIHKKELKLVFIRSHIYQLSWNYERMQNLCYCYTIYPVLKKVSSSREELKAALQSNLEYFNTHPILASGVLGMDIAAISKAKDINSEMKLALMGPLAGIGDPLYWGTIRPTLGAIASALALSGNVLGPILYFLVFNIFRELSRYLLLFRGYKEGINLLNIMKETLEKLKEVMTIVSYFIIGGMISAWSKVNFSVILYKYTLNNKIIEVSLQQQLDGIMPGLIPLIICFFLYWLLKKKVSPLICMAIIIIFGILGSFFNIIS